MNKIKDKYAFSRTMYIIEAALEYFISLMVADAYLAKLTAAVGMSDALTGILSAFVSLGCGMQIVAIFLSGNDSVKRMVTFGTVITDLAFVLVYLTPFFPIPKEMRSIVMLVALLAAFLIKNVVFSPKTNWFMSLVDDSKRGVFTANKEIISLIGGMIFTLVTGAVIDMFEAADNLEGSFIMCAITIFGLGALHIATILLAKEKKNETTDGKKKKEKKEYNIKELFLNKNLIKIVMFSVLWHLVNYATLPFYGSYKVGELGFSMLFNSLLMIGYSVVRAVCSRPMGRFADKKSFATMLTFCFIIMSAALFINIFTIPSNGYVVFTVYYLLYAVAMAGINSGTINLIYDYVPHKQRVAALALQNSLAGIAGFLTTTVVSLLVEYIQKNGNTFLGMKLYAQQVVSAIGFIMAVLTELYLIFVISKIKREN